MLKSLAGGIVTTIAIIVAIGLCLPSTYQLEADMSVKQSVEGIFTQVNNLQNWKNWAYVEIEGIADLHYEGPEEGIGAIYTWKDKYSSGRMEIIDAIPNKQLKLKLTTNYGVKESYLTFDFSVDNGVGKVKWTQTGDVGYDFRARFFMVLGGLKNSIGEQNQAALERLKTYLINAI